MDTQVLDRLDDETFYQHCEHKRIAEIERTMPLDEIIPLSERLKAAVSSDAALSLLEHIGSTRPWWIRSAQQVGWDLRRQDDGLGQDAFNSAFVQFDDHGETEESLGRHWQSFDRAQRPDDLLLIDLADEAVHHGWSAPSEIIASLERLREIAKQRRADREAKRQKDLEFYIESRKGEAQMATLPAGAAPDLIKSSADFVRGFVPPDYLVDGILQRRFCYSLTAQTGVGKTAVAMLISAHVATGRPLGEIAVEQGPVLYFAGENPTDIQTRWIGLTHRMGMDPNDVRVHFVPGARPLSQIAEAINQEVARKGLKPSLVVVDTAAAYFEGDEENSNTQLGAFARQLRSLTSLPGGPCVLILCHPTKRAADDDLIPRGGGAFLAEVDGNIALLKRESVLVATAQGKFRGSDAWTLRFELDVVRNHPHLKDSKGRQILTVVARPISEGAASALESSGERDEDVVLRALPSHSDIGLKPTDIARALKWFVKNDPSQPAHLKVIRILGRLKASKLVETSRSRWKLTGKGEQELNHLDAARMRTHVPLGPLPPIVNL